MYQFLEQVLINVKRKKIIIGKAGRSQKEKLRSFLVFISLIKILIIGYRDSLTDKIDFRSLNIIQKGYSNYPCKSRKEILLFLLI
jgi:hypothetical protein